jgi:hypothetical protein
MIWHLVKNFLLFEKYVSKSLLSARDQALGKDFLLFKKICAETFVKYLWYRHST